jgi:hypothetical protein
VRWLNAPPTAVTAGQKPGRVIALRKVYAYIGPLDDLADRFVKTVPATQLLTAARLWVANLHLIDIAQKWAAHTCTVASSSPPDSRPSSGAAYAFYP